MFPVRLDSFWHLAPPAFTLSLLHLPAPVSPGAEVRKPPLSTNWHEALLEQSRFKTGPPLARVEFLCKPHPVRTPATTAFARRTQFCWTFFRSHTNKPASQAFCGVTEKRVEFWTVTFYTSLLESARLLKRCRRKKGKKSSFAVNSWLWIRALTAQICPHLCSCMNSTRFSHVILAKLDEEAELSTAIQKKMYMQ